MPSSRLEYEARPEPRLEGEAGPDLSLEGGAIAWSEARGRGRPGPRLEDEAVPCPSGNVAMWQRGNMADEQNMWRLFTYSRSAQTNHSVVVNVALELVFFTIHLHCLKTLTPQSSKCLFDLV